MMNFADVLTLERCNRAFLGFQIGFRRCNSWKVTWEETWKNHPGAVQKLDSEVGKSVERAVQKCADLVDLENAETCAYSRYRRCRYSREGASQSLGGMGYRPSHHPPVMGQPAQ